jgi:acetyl esterase
VPLDPYLAAKLHLLEGLGPEQVGEPDFARRREEFDNDPDQWMSRVDTRTLTIDGVHGQIPIRLYMPRTKPSVGLVWAHGGGFAWGDLNMREAHVVAAELSARSSAIVASVDYRLAVNGVRYPVPLDDVQRAWHWFAREYDEVGTLAVGGASAGAALALGAVVRERDASRRLPDVMVLAYPFVHFPNPAVEDELHAELSQFPRLMRFSVGDIESMVENYVGRLSDLPHDALPGSADLRGLPPTRIVISEYDHLRGSAELLVRQLRRAGIDVESFLANGMPHGHLNRTPWLGEVDQSLAFLSAGLSRAAESRRS